jgi:tetratricopeptide (TPR) repeat protein
MREAFHFYDEAALLERLSRGLKKHSQEVIFLVGAPLSAPVAHGGPGVPGVEGVIDLIRSEFEDDLAQSSALSQTLQSAGVRQYQAAFEFLQGRRGQQIANAIIRKAVVSARLPGIGFAETQVEGQTATDDACRLMEYDTEGWFLSPGTENLGKLAANYPGRFGKSILTTNFDPLVEVALRRAGGAYFRTTLHSDGNVSQTEGTGCHVIHLHGYWYGSDTLHTGRQLTQSRPRLRDSLGQLLRNKLVVVCAYGAWDDAFTEALIDVVRDDTAYPEIIWTFHLDVPDVGEQLSVRLEPGIDRGRVNLYAGIDCHTLFPKLYQAWLRLEPECPTSVVGRSNPVRVGGALSAELEASRDTQTIVEGDVEDRPPLVEICVGREAELKSLKHSPAKIVFLTGLGGQGKSTLAARYFTGCQNDGSFSVYVWRDCKEESERFENQLASVAEKLSGGKISGEDLAKQSASSVVEILTKLIGDLKVLFVFDNVDHYVDVEAERMAGSPAIFIDCLLRSVSPSRAVFTCRPSVAYDSPFVHSCRLEGIDFDAAVQLFSQRGASSEAHEIRDAHSLTEGHAFWLDLLAIQVAKPASNVKLSALVKVIGSGGGPLPDNTLNSIWMTLKDREQTVLRSMAETVKPETEVEIGEYLHDQMHFNKLMRALKTLRALNLVVVKRRADAADVLELHPMVRQFVRRRFTRPERLSFIDAIIQVYQRYIGNNRSHLLDRPPLSFLQYWTQNAELDIAAGKFSEAFITLAEVASAFRSSRYPREFTRTARLLFSAVDWIAEHSKFKGFDVVFYYQTELLGYLGEYQEVEELLEKYQATVSEKDARYILYCELRCRLYWVRGEFTKAVEWGKIGQTLKDSGVDTRHDVTHALALAERDAGRPESALPLFLKGRALSEILDPDEFDDHSDGAYYGNIGRCLHFMGQTDSALICYQKSALLLEKHGMNQHFVNEGFIRAWIAELFVAREQFRLAQVFLRAAYLKWEHVSPPRAATVAQLLKQIQSRTANDVAIDDTEAEKICLNWILGRTVDAKYR